jgi:hypothetical protein
VRESVDRRAITPGNGSGRWRDQSHEPYFFVVINREKDSLQNFCKKGCKIHRNPEDRP